MRLSYFLSTALAVTCCLGTANAGAIPLPTMQTTNVFMNATDRDIPAPSPLATIREFSASGVSSGIYTNQLNGTAGVFGDIRTVVGGLLTQATNGISYGGVRGPNGGPLAAFVALSGSLTAPNTAEFTDGAFFAVELSTSTFDPRDPSSWAGVLLESFPLAIAGVVPGPLGNDIVAVGQNLMNISRGDALSTGNTDYNLLFNDDGETGFLFDYATTSGQPSMFEGVFLEGEQDLVLDTFGADINLLAPGTSVLDAADIATLNSIATLAGLSDLGVGGQGFATGIGADSSMGTDYFTDPAGLRLGQGSGDFFARSTEANFRPVVQAVPEPSSIAIFTIGALGLAARRRKNRS